MDHRRQLTRLYEAFNERDIETALAGLHPAVQWPNGWEGGWLQGREAVRDYWLRQWQQIDPYVEPIAFESPGAGVLRLTVRQVVRDRAGVVVADAQVVHAYELAESGLVLRMVIE